MLQLLERRAKVAVGGPLTAPTGQHLYNMGRLWIPTECEVNNHVENTILAGTYDFQYPIFRDTVHQKWIWEPNNKHGLDQFVENEHYDPHDGFRGWWVATPSIDNLGIAIKMFDRNGHIRDARADDERLYIPVCFRIAKTA